MPVSGTTLTTPPMMMNACTPTIVVRPVASSFSNVRSVRSAMRSPAPIEQQERHQHGGGADQAELLADGGEDEVALGVRDLVGAAAAEAAPGDAAVADAVQRLHDLPALAVLVAPRIEPDVDAGLHVAEHPPRGVGRDAEQHDARSRGS